ncbi:MAG: hypothetical protein K8U03_13490 [Planctomycetia bacterium]|nr:hypothetical protein [Planctomycetia bacterium]
MASNQNQGMTVAVIIFVILTVISMATAVIFVKEAGEMTQRYEKADKVAKSNEESFFAVQGELNEVKDILFPMKEKASDTRFDVAEIKAKYQADLKRYGDRLKTISAEANTATYSESLAAAITVLEQRNASLDEEKIRVAAVEKQKSALEATYQAQVDQFKMQAEKVDKEKVDIQTKLTKAEEDVKRYQLEATTVAEAKNKEINELRATMQKTIDDKEVAIVQVGDALKIKNEFISKINDRQYAATYDGQITRINPTARTVWINLGNYDNLPKNLSFSVQAQGIPAGSKVPPKAKIEVIELLGDHLAEARIVEDDLRTPILIGDNIFTSLWEPGQLTRFAFAGKIDLDGNGSDDMDQVRALVARAGGQIDSEIVNGELKGALTIETRYLVLGTVPADKAGAEAYKRVVDEAERLGVQRVPMAVFFDQIGFKREARTVQFGGGSNNLRSTERPDGGAPVSPGSVSDVFKLRRPPAAAGSAY